MYLGMFLELYMCHKLLLEYFILEIPRNSFAIKHYCKYTSSHLGKYVLENSWGEEKIIQKDVLLESTSSIIIRRGYKLKSEEYENLSPEKKNTVPIIFKVELKLWKYNNNRINFSPIYFYTVTLAWKYFPICVRKPTESLLITWKYLFER